LNIRIKEEGKEMPDVMIGETLIDGEKIEQIVEKIINLLAHNELNYNFSIYVLEKAKDKIGERYFSKD